MSVLTLDSAPPEPTYVVHPGLAAVPALDGELSPRGGPWTPEQLGLLTDRLAAAAGPLLRRIARHHPDRRWWVRLALSDEVEVWLLGWTPGQRTRPHDHGGAAGAYTVLEGTLAENFQDGRTTLRRETVPAGGRSQFGPERTHLVTNPGPGNATSVHAYSPPLLPLGYTDSVEP